MRRPLMVGFAVVITLATLLLWGAGAIAGQYKNFPDSIPDAACSVAHSSPRNVSSAMEMEVYEWVSPAGDSYQCCINQNNTGQDLFVRLIGLTGTVLESFQTPVNGTGCTPFVGLGAGFAFQCTVASGAGSPVVVPSHYKIGICRQ